MLGSIRCRWLLGSLLGFVLLLTLGYYFLPKPSLLPEIDYSQAVYDRDQKLLRLTLAADDQYRLPVTLGEISPLMQQATLLQEDRYFYTHFGVNPIALIRAAFDTYITGDRRYGASTITMQLARLAYGLDTRSMTGKLQQIFLALQLERHYRKDEILTAYFTIAPYGGNVSGIAAASLIYFHKSADQLNLNEAITLSTIPQNPVKRRPSQKVNPNLDRARQRLFQRWLSQDPTVQQYAYSFQLPLQTYTASKLPFLAPHFVDEVLKRYPYKTPIVSSLSLATQQLLERVTFAYLAEQRYKGIHNASVMLVNSQTMQVEALIGSGDFFNNDIAGQVNGARARRSPGSTLKPFIFALAIEQGLTLPKTALKDLPRQFGAYSPDNFDYQFSGPISAENALVMSRNIPALSLAEQISPDLYDFLAQAGIQGLEPKQHYGLSLALGGGELTMSELVQLYTSLANGGQFQVLNYLAATVVKTPRHILSSEASFITLDMLSKNPIPASFAGDFKVPVAWKTGTSSAYRDAWTVGVFGPYVLAVWFGDFSGEANANLIGRELAAPLFFRLAKAILQRHPVRQTSGLNSQGLNLVQVDVCRASGLLATPYCPDIISSWFIPGISPIKRDNIYRQVAINPVNGLRSCRITDKTVYKVYEFWPSDLLSLFRQAQVPKPLPPPFEPQCQIISSNSGNAPEILFPNPALRYQLTRDKQQIALRAIGDGEVQHLYWFVDHGFIGRSAPNKNLLWQATAGEHQIQVIDDFGRSASLTIDVDYLH